MTQKTSIKTSYTIPVFVSIVLQKDNKILLIKRANTGYHDGYYGCPGGSLENNETLIEACIREAREEIDVQVNASDLELVHVIQVQNEKQIIGFYLKTMIWQGEPKVNEPDKHSEVAWFDLDNLPINMTPPSKQAITNYIKNQPLSILK